MGDHYYTHDYNRQVYHEESHQQNFSDYSNYQSVDHYEHEVGATPQYSSNNSTHQPSLQQTRQQTHQHSYQPTQRAAGFYNQRPRQPPPRQQPPRQQPPRQPPPRQQPPREPPPSQQPQRQPPPRQPPPRQPPPRQQPPRQPPPHHGHNQPSRYPSHHRFPVHHHFSAPRPQQPLLSTPLHQNRGGEDLLEDEPLYCHHCDITFTSSDECGDHMKSPSCLGVGGMKHEGNIGTFIKEQNDNKAALPQIQSDNKDQLPHQQAEVTSGDKHIKEIKNEEDGDDSDDEDEDTCFCKYCKVAFKSTMAFIAHTRGIQHISLVMQAKSERGDKHYQKEKVDPKVLDQVTPVDKVVTPVDKEDTPVNNGNKEVIEEKEEEDEEEDDEDEDTGFCKYCQLNFKTAMAYFAHTRGIQHISLVMQAKSEKGDKHYQKEKVDPKVLEVIIPKPIHEEDEEEEEENYFEAALDADELNLSEESKQFLRQKKDPAKRDLNPTDLGRTPTLSSTLACPVCDVVCPGASVFKSHIQGKQHKANMVLVEQGVEIVKKKKVIPPPPQFIEATDREAKIYKELENEEEPILGLDYITEFQKMDEKAAARYVCNLCQVKCDGSSIRPHVTGVKHRLSFFKAERPSLYRHVSTFCGSNKTKKSFLTANTNDFAEELEEELGRGQVKVKIEIIENTDEENLKIEMQKETEALSRKLKEAEERKLGPPIKKSRTEYPEEFPSFNNKWEETSRGHDYRERRDNDQGYRDREQNYGYRGRYPGRRGNRGGYGDRGGHRGGYSERGGYRGGDSERGGYREGYHERDIYGDRDGYGERREPRRGYPDSEAYRARDYYDNRPPRYPADSFRDRYRDMFDHYRRYGDAEYHDRFMVEERRSLDDQALDRHRLSDPDAERRRLDDILKRREYLQKLEDERLLRGQQERNRLLHDPVDDIDMQRIKRFTEMTERRSAALESTTAQSSPAPPPPRPQYPQTASTLYNPGPAVTSMPSTIKQQPNATQAVEAARRVKEEMDKNPGLNIGEMMKKMTSSMISSEEDANAALQISTALTQALVQFRQEQMQQAKKEPEIPGLGNSSNSNVPSFLKSPATNAASTVTKINYAKTSVYPGYQPPGVVQTGSQLLGNSQLASVNMSQMTNVTTSNTANVSHADNPQKKLLDSIRLQTELIRKKIVGQQLGQAVCSLTSTPGGNTTTGLYTTTSSSSVSQNSSSQQMHHISSSLANSSQNSRQISSYESSSRSSRDRPPPESSSHHSRNRSPPESYSRHSRNRSPDESSLRDRSPPERLRYSRDRSPHERSRYSRDRSPHERSSRHRSSISSSYSSSRYKR